MSHLLNRPGQDERDSEFAARFGERFGGPPNFAAVRGYEAARLLLDALLKNDNPAVLKSTILEQKRFFGFQGDFTMDRYGDPQRRRFLIVVRDGEFESL